MTTTNPKTISKRKTLIVFISTILIGFILFVFPDVFLGVTKINGGKIGINLLFIALFQFITVTALLYVSLKILNKDFSDIGLKFKSLKRDVLLGVFGGALWTILQFTLLIPNTGGKARPDISGMLKMYDGSLLGLFSFIALGVIGGGVTEELFNRGYFINVLKSIFSNPKTGLWLSAILSIFVFSLGHMPTDALQWFDILVPTLIYTILFVKTKQLTASMVAHGTYNLAAITLTYWMYFKS